jgi:uncharacterized protein (TIGR03435 family)
MAIMSGLHAQPGGEKIEFEVASIKPGTPPVREPLPGGGYRVRSSRRAMDPGRYTADNISMFNLITQAYGMAAYQVVGPEWLKTERFDIAAKIPSGLSQKQVPQMLQRLLADRFKLVSHREEKDLPIYDLVIAKNGPKLKEWVDSTPAPQSNGTSSPPMAMGKMTKDANGYPVASPVSGRGSSTSMANGLVTERSAGLSMSSFAQSLAGRLERQVNDRTGLTGKYEFELRYAMDGMSGPDGPADGPTLPEAIQSQLGLKLEPKKGMVEALVVDHIEKTPTEN